MARFFATFGANAPYRKYFIEFDALSEEHARGAMFEAHGNRWAFLYTADDFAGVAERWNLHRLSLITVDELGATSTIAGNALRLYEAEHS